LGYDFKGTISEKDFIVFGRLISRKRRIIIYCIYCVIMLYINFRRFTPIYIEYWSNSSFQEQLYIIGWNIIELVPHFIWFLVFSAIIIALDYFLCLYDMKKVYRSDKTASNEIHFIITEEHICIEKNTGSRKITKEHIRKIQFYKDAIYIFLAINNAIIIKKNFLKNEKEYDELKVFLNEKYG